MISVGGISEEKCILPKWGGLREVRINRKLF
jgi:hypothetical protein